MGKITSIPFTLIGKFESLSSLVWFYPRQCQTSYFIAGKNSSVFISFYSMFPETSKKFFTCVTYWIKVSTRDGFCQ